MAASTALGVREGSTVVTKCSTESAMMGWVEDALVAVTAAAAREALWLSRRVKVVGQMQSSFQGSSEPRC